MITIPANMPFRVFASDFILQGPDESTEVFVEISTNLVTTCPFDTFTGAKIFQNVPSGTYLMCIADVTCSDDSAVVLEPAALSFTGVNCTIKAELITGLTLEGLYAKGTILRLQAVPYGGKKAADYVFSGWSDGVTDSTRIYTVTDDADLTATFTDLNPDPGPAPD